jgi:4'-phosphopantetheinyl transferase
MRPLAADEVLVWCRATTALSEEDVRTARRFLSEDECVRADRLRSDAARRDFIVAHDLLRRTLSTYGPFAPGDWRFITDRFGKPSIDGRGEDVPCLSFSLSHTAGCVACAISSDTAVGVDVERTDRRVVVTQLADRYFSEREAAELRALSESMRLVRFTELWTLKEAYLKSVGVGLSGSLSAVSFQFDAAGSMDVTGPSNPADCHFALFAPLPDVRLGVAVLGATPPRLVVRAQDGWHSGSSQQLIAGAARLPPEREGTLLRVQGIGTVRPLLSKVSTDAGVPGRI